MIISYRWEISLRISLIQLTIAVVINMFRLIIFSTGEDILCKAIFYDTRDSRYRNVILTNALILPWVIPFGI